MSRRRRQGASNYVERHLHLRAFSAFRIRTVLDYGEYPLWYTLCGSVVVIAIPNAHTQDDATDSLSLRSFYGKNYVLL